MGVGAGGTNHGVYSLSLNKWMIYGKATASTANTAYNIHTVKHGDTLWAIAAKYLGKGSRYPEIVKLNNLKTNVLYTGQVLKIPKKQTIEYRHIFRACAHHIGVYRLVFLFMIEISRKRRFVL